MTTQTTFAQIRMGGLFFAINDPNALPYIKINDRQARNPGGEIIEVLADTLVYATKIIVRLEV